MILKIKFCLFFIISLSIISGNIISGSIISGSIISGSVISGSVISSSIAFAEAFADDSIDNNSGYSDDDLYGNEYVITEDQLVADPLYWFNYAMFSFNDKLYFWVLKPVARGYKFITPSPLRRGLKNFFHLFFPHLILKRSHGLFHLLIRKGIFPFLAVLDSFKK
ncbi:MAG: VacJ family lipoprotein [Desulfamplus sp.]|nr:VacJ family lipoprotein [Desulfamplus sp.]